MPFYNEENISNASKFYINEELEKYFKIFDSNKSKQIGLNPADKVLKKTRNEK
jgi:hypothetical protein